MTRILIVDDSLPRTEQIQNILAELHIPENNITSVSSAYEAKREMFKTQYDVLLLDLVLPSRPDTEPQPNGGIDLLHEVLSLDNYKTPHTVFVISAFDDALQRLTDLSNQMYCAQIKYDPSSEEWKTRLKNYLDQSRRTSFEQKSYEYDVAILCALENPELVEVKKLPFDWKPHNEFGDSTDYFVGHVCGRKLVCAASYEMGLSSAAVLATKMINTFRPKYIIMTGIAGGVDEERLCFGDIMIADPCFDYESGKRVYTNGQSQFKPDYRQIRLENSITQIMRRISARADILSDIHRNCVYDKPKTPPQVEIGPFGSGAAVLSDPTIIERIKDHNRKFLGFDMEAYAVMLAGELSCVPKAIPIVIKSVSDFGTGKTDQYQKYAAYTSAKLLEVFLEELFQEQ